MHLLLTSSVRKVTSRGRQATGEKVKIIIAPKAGTIPLFDKEWLCGCEDRKGAVLKETENRKMFDYM
jgi:hypothetical protein